MELEDLEKRIDSLSGCHLLLLCRAPSGKEQVMTVQECCRTGSVYIRAVIPDSLDKLLEDALGE